MTFDHASGRAMIALLVSAGIGYYFFAESGIFAGLATGFTGYTLFVIYSLIRASALARDPVQKLAMAVEGKPRGKDAEKYLSSIIVPLVGAFLVSLLLM